MPINTSIEKTRTVESNNGDEKFTVYQVTVRGDFNQIIHTVDRRYREFESLHHRLSSLLSIPHLPGKVLLHRRSSKIIEQRRQLLDIYLNEILKRFQQHSLMPDELSQFLQLSTDKIEQETYSTIEPIEEENPFTLKHAPCLTITDQCPWTNDHRELFPDAILTGLMQSMYDV